MFSWATSIRFLTYSMVIIEKLLQLRNFDTFFV